MAQYEVIADGLKFCIGVRTVETQQFDFIRTPTGRKRMFRSLQSAREFANELRKDDPSSIEQRLSDKLQKLEKLLEAAFEILRS